MSLDGWSMFAVTWSFPRVSGDEPGPAMSATVGTLFSPRERG